MSLRIVCVDDSPLCVLGIREAIEHSHHGLLGSFHRVEELLEYFQTGQADVVISEVRIGKIDILESWPAIAERFPEIKLILYSYDDNPTHIARASAIDAWDYVLKKNSIHRLVAACDAALQETRAADSLIFTARNYLMQARCITTSLPHPLTRREQQILVHLSLGLSNREIARSLHISLETVKEHVQNVLRKVQASDRTAAAVWAIRNGTPPMLIDAASMLAAQQAKANTPYDENGGPALDRTSHGRVSS